MIIEVAAGLVFRDRKLLITQRAPEAHCGGLWEFPGGKRETGETFEDCLKRELQEELGIEVQVHNLLEALQHDYPDKSVYLKFYRCQWLRNEPQTLHCHDLVWVTCEELANYDFPAADARLLAMLRSSAYLWAE